MRRAIVTETIETEAQFYDIDPMDIVWHGNYPRYFELARVALLDKIDYSYAAMVESGYAWPVVDMNIRYMKSIKLRDRIMVEAGVVEWENRLKIDFEIRHKETNKRLCKGYSVHVAVDIETDELLWETPPVFRKKLEPYL